MRKYDKETTQLLLNAFIETYGQKYDSDEMDFILYKIENDLNLNASEDIMHQIYAYLGLIPNSENRYLAYYDLICKYFRLDQNILEIGGGYIPVLSKYIDQEQIRIKKGTITVYDPVLVMRKLGNIILCKKCYNESHFPLKTNLLLGIMPCEATEMVIKTAAHYHKDLFLAPCGCIHLKNNGYFVQTYSVWENHIYRLIKESFASNSIIETEHLNESFNCKYPIYCIKRK